MQHPFIHPITLARHAGILADYTASDGETFKDAVAPLLADTIESETELDDICTKMHSLMFGTGNVKEVRPALNYLYYLWY